MESWIVDFEGAHCSYCLELLAVGSIVFHDDRIDTVRTLCKDCLCLCLENNCQECNFLADHPEIEVPAVYL